MQTDFIYGNELDKACFQHDMAYGESKDLAKRTHSDKVLRDKKFKIASDPKDHGYQTELASMVYKFFDKKSSGKVVDTSLANNSVLVHSLKTNKEFKNLCRQILFTGMNLIKPVFSMIWLMVNQKI